MNVGQPQTIEVQIMAAKKAPQHARKAHLSSIKLIKEGAFRISGILK